MLLLLLPPLVHRLVLFVLYLQFLSHIVHLNAVQKRFKNALVKIKGNNGIMLGTVTITKAFVFSMAIVVYAAISSNLVLVLNLFCVHYKKNK